MRDDIGAGIEGAVHFGSVLVVLVVVRREEAVLSSVAVLVGCVACRVDGVGGVGCLGGGSVAVLVGVGVPEGVVDELLVAVELELGEVDLAGRVWLHVCAGEEGIGGDVRGLGVGGGVVEGAAGEWLR